MGEGKMGKIKQESIRKALDEYGFFTTKKDLTQLVERYDKNRDGMISYSEFFQEITPKSPLKY